MISASEHLHQQIEYLQSLLSSSSATTNNSQYNSDSSAPSFIQHSGAAATTIGNYEIRSCLRQIQATLLRDEFFDLQLLLSQQQQQYYNETATTITLEQQDLGKQLVDDLVTLVTLNDTSSFSPSSSQLVQNDHRQDHGMEFLDSLIVPRAVEILIMVTTAPPPSSSEQQQGGDRISMSDNHLQRLFPKLLYLIDEDDANKESKNFRNSNRGGAASFGSNHHHYQQKNSNTRHDDDDNGLLAGLLELANQHLTSFPRLEQVLEEDEDIWIALQILLPALLRYRRRRMMLPSRTGRGTNRAATAAAAVPGSFSSSSSSSMVLLLEEQRESIEPELHVLTGAILDYWKAKVNLAGSTLVVWLQQHLEATSQQELSRQSSFSVLARYHSQFSFMTRPAGSITAASAISKHQRGDYRAFPDYLPRHADECLGMVEHYGADLVEMALQLLEEVVHTSSVDNYNRRGHRAAEDDNDDDDNEDEDRQRDGRLLLVLKYSTLATNWIALFGEDFPSISSLTRSLWRALEAFIVEFLEDPRNRGNNVMMMTDQMAEDESIDDNIQMGATDTLWRLTQVQQQAGFFTSTAMQEHDVSIIVLTIFRLWKHASYYWTPTTQEWVQTNILSSENNKYSMLVRRALQVALLSMTYFPEQQTHAENSLVLSNLISMCFPSNSDEKLDPWHSLVYEQLSDYSSQMEQRYRV